MKENNTQPPTKVGKTWFFERGDGKIIACGEGEAWNLTRNKSNWQRNDFKLIGVSDGTTYVKALQDAGAEKLRVDAEIQKKNDDLNRYINTLDRFKFELLLDDTDEKVVKVKGIIDGIKREVSTLTQEFSKGQQEIIDRAFKAELEQARGKLQMPSNQDVFTPRGDRERILRNMPR